MLSVVFPDSGTVWVFCLTALALLVIPGPAVLYVVVQGAEQGRRTGLASVAGVHLGTLVHVAAATVGLSALIVASAGRLQRREVRGSSVSRLHGGAEAARPRRAEPRVGAAARFL